jgi:hypothetical protein
VFPLSDYIRPSPTFDISNPKEKPGLRKTNRSKSYCKDKNSIFEKPLTRIGGFLFSAGGYNRFPGGY